jgi:glutamate--cysteine ligase
MMTRTCTVQVNLDFGSEADMVKKFRVSLALQPIATALFADSPFTDGKPNGYLSYRSHIWTDTDPDRTGMLDFVFEDGFGFERYADYLLDGGPWNRLCALPAFWVGLLYDTESLDAAWDLVKDFSMAERHALRDGVPKHALKLPFRGESVRELSLRVLEIAGNGLKRRANLNRHGVDETMFLQPLIEFAEANQTPAERKLELFHGPWQGSVDPVFKEFAY